jgi:hypothetical protein
VLHHAGGGAMVTAMVRWGSLGALAILVAACGGTRTASDAGAGGVDGGGASGSDGTSASSSSGGASSGSSGGESSGSSGASGGGSGGPGSDGSTGAPCKLGSDCAAYADTFCQKDSCDPNASGTCALIPGTRETGYCSSGTAFVCGCDGVTYDYPCLAHAMSVNVASQGPCPLAEGGAPCATTSDCRSSALYCNKTHCADAMGTCAGMPTFSVCFAALDGGVGVCGCDHQQYDSACEAASSGVSVDFQGTCPPLPSGPCTSQADCGGSGYAQLVYCKPSACGAAAGTCTAIPGACSNIEMQVCGCNGTTYPNACYAEVAKVAFYTPDGGCP